MKRIFGFIFLICLVSKSAFAIIIGPDNRRYVPKTDAIKNGTKPVSFLFIKKNDGSLYGCTASWIADNLLLTARHCVANAKRILVYNQFENYVSDIRSIGVRYYVDESSSEDQTRWIGRPNGQDWAVLETATADGKTFGHYSIIHSDILEQNYGLKIPAYQGDMSQMLTLQYCSYHPRDFITSWRIGLYRQGLFETDCDMVGYSSGSPLLSCNRGTCSIVGVHSGEFDPKEFPEKEGHLPNFESVYANTEVRSSNFILQVQSLLSGNAQGVRSFLLEKMNCNKFICLSK